MESMPEVTPMVAVATASALGGLAMAAYMAQEPDALHKFDMSCLELQSRALQGEEATRMSHLAHGSKEGYLEEYMDGTLFTQCDAFDRGEKLSNNGNCLGWRPGPDQPYKWLSYSQVRQTFTDVGAGLLTLGLAPKNDTYVGVFCKNRKEYNFVAFGCWLHSMVIVPLYDTLGKQALVHICNQAGLKVIVCDSEEKVTSLLDIKDDIKTVETLVLMDPISEAVNQKVKDVGWNIKQLSEVEEEGKQNPQPAHLPTKEDLFLICYTSGTTGNPKGVMLTHGGFMSTCCATGKLLEKYGLLPKPGEEIHLSYLPLAHAYEQTLQASLFGSGGSIGYFQGDIKLLTDDIKCLRPTMFPSVPRLLNRIYDKVMSTVRSSFLKSKLFDYAIKKKSEYVKRGVYTTSTIWDKLVFNKIRMALGGRVRYLVTGSAPISPEVLTFLRCTFGLVLEGYGQTESNAVATVTVPGDVTTGHVGVPLSCCKIKVVDVEEMGYFAKENKGEVCFKGVNVFKGYLHDEAKTAETIDEDGWLHTGDIGAWQPNGTLKIIDRKKHIFKLAQGEYVAPEKIENVYTTDMAVAQAFVHGESLKASLVAIIVPDPEVFPGWASKELSIKGSMEELCSNETVKKAVLDRIVKTGKARDLKSFEQVRAIHLFPELFSVDNDLLTPTFKLKRHYARQHFAKELEQLYVGLQ